MGAFRMAEAMMDRIAMVIAFLTTAACGYVLFRRHAERFGNLALLVALGGLSYLSLTPIIIDRLVSPPVRDVVMMANSHNQNQDSILKPEDQRPESKESSLDSRVSIFGTIVPSIGSGVSSVESPYVGSAIGKTYHRPDCFYITKQTRHLVGFSSREEAERLGRHPCDNCLRDAN